MISLLSGYGPSVVAGLPPLPRMILPASSVSRLPPLRRPSLRIRSAQSMYSRVMRVNDSGSAAAGDWRSVGRCRSRRKLAMGGLLVGCGGHHALPSVCRSGRPGTDRPRLFVLNLTGPGAAPADSLHRLAGEDLARTLGRAVRTLVEAAAGAGIGAGLLGGLGVLGVV